MLNITEKAEKGLLKILKSKGDFIGLRLIAKGDLPGAYESEFRPVREGDPQTDDVLIESGGLKIFLDPASAQKLDGATIDLTPTFRGPSFKIDYPQPHWDDPLKQQVQTLITEKVNPGIASHGGYISLLDVKDGMAFIAMGGGCQGCGLSHVTLKQGIDVMIRENIPGIKKVVDQTDHADGKNPYYQPNAMQTGAEASPLS